MVIVHRVRRWCDERAHHATCRCGWRVQHVDADVVRAAVDRHEETR